MVLVCFTYSNNIFALESHIDDTEDLPLSSLTEQECWEILNDQGVYLPEELNGIDIREVISSLENDPQCKYTVNSRVLSEFLDSVDAAISTYYNRPNVSPASLSYTLQYSTLYSWSPGTMDTYNCYGYAIGRDQVCVPGDFSDNSYNHTDSIYDVANVVIEDLHGDLGYECVVSQTTRPSSTSGWNNVIAVRKDTTFDLYGIFNDFHFAKLSSSSWYHKPGKTAVLKFNNSPSNSIIWCNEAYDGEPLEPDIWYESDIIYIKYRFYHTNTTYTWTENHYHSGNKHYYQYGDKCPTCGEFENLEWVERPCTGACITPWAIDDTATE